MVNVVFIIIYTCLYILVVKVLRGVYIVELQKENNVIISMTHSVYAIILHTFMVSVLSLFLCKTIAFHLW